LELGQAAFVSDLRWMRPGLRNCKASAPPPAAFGNSRTVEFTKSSAPNSARLRATPDTWRAKLRSRRVSGVARRRAEFGSELFVNSTVRLFPNAAGGGALALQFRSPGLIHLRSDTKAAWPSSNPIASWQSTFSLRNIPLSLWS